MTDLNLITDIAGISIGHATDLKLGSGVTVVRFDRPAVASGVALGGAPGGRDTGLLAPEMTVETVDAFVLSGGSAFGLDAAGGAQASLLKAGRGFPLGDVLIPIVPQAILMDLLNGGDKNWGPRSPYWDMGFAAAEAARPGAFALGTVGAGTGATTATIKGGLGSASATTRSGHRVGVVIAVNAVGTATIGDGPHFWSSPFERDGEFGGRGWPATFTASDLALRAKGVQTTGTTIGVIATDAVLTKTAAHRLALMAHDGLARALFPTHLPMDGDTVLAAATGEKPIENPDDWVEICHLATQVAARAIARGVYEATALPVANAQPAWRDRFGG
ncbi:P1 family peptidase [Kaistia dalseonensis]|uniref:L-aminopeptidase/D-esterase-like protein n=1 Tax=Kaistia dalseonensis TaxID=410840 RepID=A0ABU0HBQ4_9HYPH|nr:P1 family peptidase [Kaistia dalseonensis]MCX5496678.1 P1 family peptidase [Kaistia dalseonensis]MDQ0439303.1 L-aminopeptidase/D-esterase-like protein [Kaistia dalseonensis]